MIYTVVYTDAKGGGEKLVHVEADEVSADPHWVQFRKNDLPQKIETVDGCDNCGRTVSRPRVSAGHRRVVALYPSPRVRSVTLEAQ